MADFALDDNGDIRLLDGDIQIVRCVKQDVRTRLRWILGEWRLGPEMGVDYYGSILQKNPDRAAIRAAIRGAVMEDTRVQDVRDIVVEIDPKTRTAKISLTIITDEETFREEVELYG